MYLSHGAQLQPIGKWYCTVWSILGPEIMKDIKLYAVGRQFEP